MPSRFRIHVHVWLRSLSSESQTHSLVGPPDNVSNIRPIKHRQPASQAERTVQELEKEVWQYNHDFWTNHNTQFKIEKEKFTKTTLGEGVVKVYTAHSQGKCVCVYNRLESLHYTFLKQGVGKLTTQELSVFYKIFLSDKYSDHVSYTRGWLKLQSRLTWCLLKLNLSQMSKVFKRDHKQQ